MPNATTLKTEVKITIGEKYELDQIAEIVDDFFGGGGSYVFVSDINTLMSRAFPCDDPLEAPITMDELRYLQKSAGEIIDFISKLYEVTSQHTSVKSKYGIRKQRQDGKLS